MLEIDNIPLELTRKVEMGLMKVVVWSLLGHLYVVMWGLLFLLCFFLYFYLSFFTFLWKCTVYQDQNRGKDDSYLKGIEVKFQRDQLDFGWWVFYHIYNRWLGEQWGRLKRKGKGKGRRKWKGKEMENGKLEGKGEGKGKVEGKGEEKWGRGKGRGRRKERGRGREFKKVGRLDTWTVRWFYTLSNAMLCALDRQ